MYRNQRSSFIPVTGLPIGRERFDSSKYRNAGGNFLEVKW
jgi:hypothetical protein